MKAVVQRVRRAFVEVEGKKVGEIGRGIVVLCAFEKGDREDMIPKFSKKILNLRIFEDENGRMNYSAIDLGLEVLLISNFTVAGDTKKGRRPSYDRAMPPDEALRFFDLLFDEMKKSVLRTERGVFGARMLVSIENDGPVTLIVEL